MRSEIWPGIYGVFLSAVICFEAFAEDSERIFDYSENGAVRVGSFEPSDAQWTVSGEDAAHFTIENGVLRFYDAERNSIAIPDFENPKDADADNTYTIQIQSTAQTIQAKINIVDREEPGSVTLSSSRPVINLPIHAAVTDPDDVIGPVEWHWERFSGPAEWLTISDASGDQFIPTSADAGRHIRAVAIYEDRLGTNRHAYGTSANPVVGHRLAGLEVYTDKAIESILRPQFDPVVLHYAIPCADSDQMNLRITAPAGLQVAVNGIQHRHNDDALMVKVPVHSDSDVEISLYGIDGAQSVYTVHCLSLELTGLNTRKPANAKSHNEMYALVAGAYPVVIDENAVPRLRYNAKGEAGFIFRRFSNGLWAHVLRVSEHDWVWRVLNRSLEIEYTVRSAPPLVTTGRHDFQILDDGGSLLMAYEPALRDFSSVDFMDEQQIQGQDLTAMKTRDSIIQIVEPNGTARWTWNSWGRLPLEDCSSHRFPDDYAHVNSLQWTRDGILASFRGCSSIMMIDPEAELGEEVVWRIGATNLESDEFSEHRFGPPPMPIVADPENTFCGQHSAKLFDDNHLYVFDNGVACVVDEHTRAPLSRQGNTYSRAVKYAIDHENNEVIFVRQFSLNGRRDVLGRIGGHIEVLPDGDWLVSWGRGAPKATSDRETVNFMNIAATRFDPETGDVSLIIEKPKYSLDLRAIPVDSLTLVRRPEALTVGFSESMQKLDSSDGDSILVPVVFSRPVVGFDINTPSIRTGGSKLINAAPEIESGKAAYAWVLELIADGTSPVTVEFVEDVSCELGGICTADSTKLSSSPETMVVRLK